MPHVGPERVLGHYQLGALMARGATGAVYRGLDLRSGGVVAIKAIEHLPEGAAGTRGERTARLALHVEAMRALRHPNIIAVHEGGCTDVRDYLVMELGRGSDLTRHTHSAALLPPNSVLSLAVGVADALACAHGKGVLHGDVKPANVLYDPQSGAAKVSDFGIARPSARWGSAPVDATPVYMAPERLCGGRIVPASDQFSLAVMLYRLACGRLPFPGNTRPEIVWNMVNREPVPLLEHAAGFPAALGPLLVRALASEPTRRFASMEHMARGIQEVLEDVQLAAEGRRFQSARLRSRDAAGPEPRQARPQDAGSIPGRQ